MFDTGGLMMANYKQDLALITEDISKCLPTGVDLDIYLQKAGIVVDILADIVPEDVREQFAIPKKKFGKERTSGSTYKFSHVYFEKGFGWRGYKEANSNWYVFSREIDNTTVKFTIDLVVHLDNGSSYVVREELDFLLADLQHKGRKLKSEMMIDLDTPTILYGESPSWLEDVAIQDSTYGYGYQGSRQYRQEFLAGVWRTIIGIAEFMGLKPHELLTQAEAAYNNETK